MIIRETHTSARPSVVRIAVRRILASIPILFGMVTAVFMIAHILPGDPAAMFLSPTLPSAVAESARQSFGLDQPLTTQFGIWVSHALTLDFGISFSTNRNVSALIAEAFPVTLTLGLAAFVTQVALGIGIAVSSARRAGTTMDRFFSAGGLLLYATPTFVFGIVLVSVFAFGLRIFPSAHWSSLTHSGSSDFGVIIDRAWHLVLPVCTIAIPGAAGFSRYIRTNLLRVLERPFILAARSHGISERRILWKYALPPALIPAISLGGLELGTLLAGTVVTETLFALPGMGRLTVSAVLSRDYPLLIGCTIVSGCVVIVSNLLADILHSLLDPRTSSE
jgi:peptide/nickel transport system permease protein